MNHANEARAQAAAKSLDSQDVRRDPTIDGEGRGRAAVLMFITQGSLAAINLPATLIIARTLGPVGLGTYQLIYRLAAIAISVAQLGYIHAFAWATTSATDLAAVRRTFRRAVAYSSIQGAVVLALGALAGFGSGRPGEMLAWIAICAYPLVNILAANLANCYRGLLMIKHFAAVRLSQGFMWITLIVTAALTSNLTVTTVVIALLTAQAVSAAVGIILAYKCGFLAKRGIARQARESADLRRFALRVWPGMLIREWNVYLDQIVIGIFLGASQLGIYAVAVSLTMTLGLLGAPLVNTAQPVVQAAAPGERPRVVGQLVGVTVIVVVAAGTLLVLAAPWLVPIIYGSEFAASVLLVQILAIGAVLDNINSCLHGVLLGLGRPAASSRSAGLGLVLSVAAWPIALPWIGIGGAAAVSVLSYLVVCISMIRSTKAGLGITYRQFILLVWAGRQGLVTFLMHATGRRVAKES